MMIRTCRRVPKSTKFNKATAYNRGGNDPGASSARIQQVDRLQLVHLRRQQIDFALTSPELLLKRYLYPLATHPARLVLRCAQCARARALDL